MGTNYYLVKNRPSIDSGLHIGKSSFGWRFLFHTKHLSIWFKSIKNIAILICLSIAKIYMVIGLQTENLIKESNNGLE